MQTMIIIILVILLVIVAFQMVKYKIGLMFLSEYMEKQNISPTKSDIDKCKQAVINKILHKKFYKQRLRNQTTPDGIE